MYALYLVCAALHLLAAFLWLGHMVFWSLVVGPVCKRFEPAERRDELREAAHRHGGLGWPALTVFLVTGVVMLHMRGLLSLDALQAFFAEPPGHAFGTKLVLVVGMVLFQTFVGHRPAPRLIYLNMLAAFVIVALSVLLVRHAELGLPAVNLLGK